MTPTSTLQLACPTCGDEATGGRLPDRPHCLIPVAAGAKEAPAVWGALTRPVSVELLVVRNYTHAGALMANMHRWHLKSRHIDVIVTAPDQWSAWDTLRDQPLNNFGLIVEAEPNENANPVSIHTAALMFRWRRDDDARAVIRTALAFGLPDTTTADMQTAGRE